MKKTSGLLALAITLSLNLSAAANPFVKTTENLKNYNNNEDEYEDLTHLGFDDLLSMETSPPSIMSSHIHLAEEAMIGYQYMLMNMKGNLNGVTPVSTDSILQDFLVAPTEMTMQMHMIHVMRAFTDNLTVMLMLPYTEMWMNHKQADGTTFQHLTRGLGDVAFKANFVAYSDEHHHLTLLGGYSMPTGSLQPKDDHPGSNHTGALPYPMRLGSGTFEFIPGITYFGNWKQLGWGTNTIGRLRLGKNNRNYRLGHQVTNQSWLFYELLDWLSPSIGVKTRFRQNIEGADSELLPGQAPTADPLRQGGLNVSLTAGLNIFASKGLLKGQGLGFNFEYPIYQSLAGPQMATTWALSGGYQWLF